MEEIWKDIVGYEGLYQISNYGRVKSVTRKVNCRNGTIKTISEKILASNPNNRGYYSVQLCYNSLPVRYLVHRLVANAFIPNPDNKEQVNHIDEDKANNSVDNLNWMTAKENTNFGTKNQRVSKANINNPLSSKSVTNGIEIYPSAAEAHRQLSCDSSSILKSCKNPNKTCGGYHWNYV